LLFVLKNVEVIIIICSLKKILSVLLIVMLIMLLSNISMTFKSYEICYVRVLINFRFLG
jgi:hypothetical protein